MSSEQMQNEGTSFTASEPELCANGCGFFGTPTNMNLCSKCYRDIRSKEDQAAKAKAVMEKSLSFNSKDSDVVVAAPTIAPAPIKVLETKVVVEETSSSVELPAAVASAAPEQPKGPSRCFSCNKKVGLTGFKCKCGSMFCGVHRYPEKHECSFDFKSIGRDAIAKANPLVKADKLERF